MAVKKKTPVKKVAPKKKKVVKAAPKKAVVVKKTAPKKVVKAKPVKKTVARPKAAPVVRKKAKVTGHLRVQTAEGWRRMMARKKMAKQAKK